MELGREEKLDQLVRILESRTMHGSENLKSFLKFVVDKSLGDGGDQLKEYTIATEVFRRSVRFSPRNDSVVRVQASRLRLKLHEYYATEGKDDPVLIELPKGHYNPVFSLIEHTDDRTQGTADVSDGENNGASQAGIPTTDGLKVAGTRKWRWRLALVGVVAVVLFGAALWYRSGQRTGEPAGSVNRSGAGPVWEPFLKAEDQTLLVLSNPAVYRFTNPNDPQILLRDSITLTPDQIKRIEGAFGSKFMVRNWPGRLIISGDQFTGVGEALGLSRITDLFRSHGLPVLIKQSRTVSAEDLKNHNVVLLGSVWVNEWSGKLTIKDDFNYTPNATIENRNRQPGEEQEYRPRFDSGGKLTEDYAIITVKPNISDKNTVMVLAGIHSEGTQAAADYVASPEYLGSLNERLLQMPVPPKHYQALLRVAVDNGIPTTITLLAVHALHGSIN